MVIDFEKAAALRKIAGMSDSPVDPSEFEHGDLAMLFEDGRIGGLWKEQLRHSYPSDYIVLDGEDSCGDLLLETVKNAGVRKVGIPGDLFEADMVPMKDALFFLENPGIWYRIVTKYERKYMVCDMGTTSYVLAFEKLGDISERCPSADLTDEETEALEANEEMYVISPFVKVVSENAGDPRFLAKLNRVVGTMEQYRIFDHMLKMWYGLMILLLNPATNEVFMERKGKAKVRQHCLVPRKNPERKAVYVKQHHVGMDIWDEVARRNGIERRTLSWYVIGHWREYKESGKKVFVQPHWKGPLRELERNVDTNRRRRVQADISRTEER